MKPRAEKRTLRLDGARRMLIFHGLAHEVEHNEACAAIDFHYTFIEPKSFASRASIRDHLERMRIAHETRVELAPCLFDRDSIRKYRAADSKVS